MIAAIGVGGYLWLRQHDAAVRAEAQSEILAAEVDSLKGVVVKDSLESARKDSIILGQQRQLYDQERAIITLETSAIQNTARISSNLRAQIGADLQPLFDSLVASHEHQLELKDEQIAIKQELIELEQEKVASRDSTIMAIRRLNASLEARIEQLENQTERSLLDKVGEIAPWAALAYAFGRSR